VVGAAKRTGRDLRTWLVGTVALAIAILAAPMSTPTADTVVAGVWRINAGAGSASDAAGRPWDGDRDFRGTGGIQHATGTDIRETTDDVLYQTNRWGMSGYDIPVGVAGRYVVRLMFAETVFSDPGVRVFDVLAEGQTVVSRLDLVAAVGYATAHDEVREVEVRDGVLNLEFRAIADDPMISALEVTRTDADPSTIVASPPPAAPTSTPTAPTSTTVAPLTTVPTAPPTTAAPTSPPSTSPPPPPTTTTTTTTTLARASYPGPTNTGVPAGTSLRPSGGFTVTQQGAVIEGLDVQGCIQVRASNVTIRRTRVRGSCFNGAIDTGYGDVSGVLIEDVELDGGNQNANAALLGNSGFTCRRCNIHHGGSGIRMTSNVVIEDSWVHDLYGADDSHNSGVGSNGGSNFTLRRNNIDCGTLPNCSGAFVLYGDFNPITNVLAEGNLFNGGGFCVYAGSVTGKNYPLASTVRFHNNAFGRSVFARCGYYGPVHSWAGGAHEWTGNFWADTKEPL
jgi:hypothetical protein